MHTPDGTPCGLLNHLTKHCEVTVAASKDLVAKLPEVLYSLGMSANYKADGPKDSCIVLLDGKVVGKLARKRAEDFVNALRFLKVEGREVGSKS